MGAYSCSSEIMLFCRAASPPCPSPPPPFLFSWWSLPFFEKEKQTTYSLVTTRWKLGFSGHRYEVSVCVFRVSSAGKAVAAAPGSWGESLIHFLNPNTNSEQKFLKETDSRLATNKWKNFALSFLGLNVELSETMDVLQPKLLFFKIMNFSEISTRIYVTKWVAFWGFLTSHRWTCQIYFQEKWAGLRAGLYMCMKTANTPIPLGL